MNIPTPRTKSPGSARKKRKSVIHQVKGKKYLKSKSKRRLNKKKRTKKIR